MRTLAIVPVKSFSTAKHRLSGALASGSRRSLVQAMFADVMGALRRTENVDAIVVVTDDIAAESIARGDGATVLGDARSAGQSDATEVGIRHAEKEGFDRVLLVPGDTPLVAPDELDQLLERCERDRFEVAIVPDRHGTGTNALVISPPDAFAPSFGPGSFNRHVAAAKAAGLAYRTIEVPSLGPDVDTPEDLEEVRALIQRTHRVAQRTRGALAQLERSGAHAAPGGGRDAADLTVEV